MWGKTYNLKYFSRQVGNNLHEMSNPIFMDNKKQYRQLLYLPRECLRLKQVTVFSEETEVFPPRIISFSTALTEN